MASNPKQNEKILSTFTGLGTDADKVRVLVTGLALVASDSTAEELERITSAPSAGGPDSPLHKARDIAQVKRDLAAQGFIKEDPDAVELPESDDQLAGVQPVPKDPGDKVPFGAPIKDGGIAANIEAAVDAKEIEDIDVKETAKAGTK